ncbi:MAG: hypothetical protein C0408_02030 [Odoribacter sp.]|nr:hypothetical protein [Odoribacter sp.]
MEMFKNTRLNRGKAILRKKMARMKRTRFKGNIRNAKTIGLVWDASNPDDFPALSWFHQNMAEKKTDVKILGYFPGKHLPDKLTAIRYLTCLKKDDISFTFRPVSPETETFINTRFDILIDINFKDLFPLRYISYLSLAGFKVGIFDNANENSPYDLMMEFNKSTDINTYLTQVIFYLEMINAGSNNKGE